jgi:hypothetical protein
MPQSYFTPHLPSPLVVLAFLGTGFFLVTALLAALVTFALGKRRLARWLLLASLGGGTLYLAVLVAVSLASREQVLRKGDRKYFCEMDCHLAYSLQDVTTKPLANATRYIVSIQTWFDPNTIASFRGNAPLTPNPREVFVVDESRRSYWPSPAGMEALERERGNPSTPLSRELRPGEFYTTTLVFDLPERVRRPRLFLGDTPGLELLLIDHENSLFHKKITFAL